MDTLKGIFQYGLMMSFDLSWVPIGVAILCVPLVPVGALICAMRARSNGLSATRYAIVGALSSALFLIPWFLLILRMRGVSIPKIVTRSLDVAAYAAWLLGPTALLSYAAVNQIVIRLQSDQIERHYIYGHEGLYTVSVGLCLLNIAVYAFSLFRRSQMIQIQNVIIYILAVLLTLAPFRRGWVISIDRPLTPDEPAEDGIDLSVWASLLFWMPVGVFVFDTVAIEYGIPPPWCPRFKTCSTLIYGV